MDPQPAGAIRITENAAKRVKFLANTTGIPETMLRLVVSGGGCSGFKYGFFLESVVDENDYIFENYGAKLVVDSSSFSLLAGAEVDYVSDLAGSAFQVCNPNAISKCGCGKSFVA